MILVLVMFYREGYYLQLIRNEFQATEFQKDEEVNKPSNLEESGKLFEEFCIIPKVETESVNTQSTDTEDMMFKRIDAGEFIDKRQNGWNHTS